MIIDISNALYCKEKESGKIYKVTGIFLPLGKPSGKDLTVEPEDFIDEWKAIDEVEIIKND